MNAHALNSHCHALAQEAMVAARYAVKRRNLQLRTMDEDTVIWLADRLIEMRSTSSVHWAFAADRWTATHKPA